MQSRMLAPTFQCTPPHTPRMRTSCLEYVTIDFVFGEYLIQTFTIGIGISVGQFSWAPMGP